MESDHSQLTLKNAVKSLIAACKNICKNKPADKAKIFMKELVLFDNLCDKLNDDVIAKIFDEAENSVRGRLHLAFMEHALVDKQFSVVIKGKDNAKKIILRFNVFLEEALNMAVKEYSKLVIDDHSVLHVHRDLMIKLLTVYSIYKEDATDYINAIRIYGHMMDTESLESGGGPDLTQLLGPNGPLNPDTIQNLMSSLNGAFSNGMKDENGNPIDVQKLIEQTVPPELLPPEFASIIASNIPKLVGQMKDGELDHNTQQRYMQDMQMQFQQMFNK